MRQTPFLTPCVTESLRIPQSLRQAMVADVFGLAPLHRVFLELPTFCFLLLLQMSLQLLFTSATNRAHYPSGTTKLVAGFRGAEGRAVATGGCRCVEGTPTPFPLGST